MHGARSFKNCQASLEFEIVLLLTGEPIGRSGPQYHDQGFQHEGQARVQEVGNRDTDVSCTVKYASYVSDLILFQ